MKRIIVDLDGTLANIDHRLHFIKGEHKDYDSFYEACDKDEPNQWCVELVRAMHRDGVNVHIVTARPDSLEEKTVKWLLRNGLVLSRMTIHFVRTERSRFSKDSDLKAAWLHRNVRNGSIKKEEILFVVEDRKRVVEMWRNYGLTVLQCDDWGDNEAK